MLWRLRGDSTIAMAGAILACLALLMLALGQRNSQRLDGSKNHSHLFISGLSFLVFLLQS